MKKKIIAITGIRSEYDILKPILIELKKKNLVKLIVSGAHLTKIHNFSKNLILKDKIKINYQIKSLNNFNLIQSRSRATSILIKKINEIVVKEHPDFLLVVGDREEAIAMSIVGNYNNVLVAHVAGGDLAYGNSDDPIRYATSKLSHIHFVFSSNNKKNLIRFGEESFRIFNTGNPIVDLINKTKKISIKKISEFLKEKIYLNKYLIFIQHPTSSEKNKNLINYRKTLNALKLFCLKYNFKVVCIAPNSDPGSKDIINLIMKYRGEKWLIFKRNIETKFFINLIKNCFCIIGNSSMGILESPFYKKIAINVGSRQKGRLNAGNVFYVNNSTKSIIKSLENILNTKKFKKILKVYKTSNPSKKISKIISNISTNDNNWYTKKKLC